MNSSSPNAISLDDWQLIKVSGADNQTYLQGQLTSDLTKLTEQNAQFSAHCDATGKMWSNLLLFRRNNDIFYIVRKSVVEKQVAELKKYAIFSKVTIEPVDDLYMIAFDGIPENIINAFKDEKQNCFTDDNGTTSLLLPSKRIIQICSTPPYSEKLLPTDYWKLLAMKDGYAIIDKPNMQTFLPQACNLQLIDAISFDKGCYCGQEMVARAQYRGANRRALFLLTGQTDLLPQIGDQISYQIGNNWREGGVILAVAKDENGQTYIQLVLNSDIDKDTLFKVKDEKKSYLTIR